MNITVSSEITARARLAADLLAASMEVLLIGYKSIEDYGRRLRGLTRGLWNGEIDRFGFIDNVFSAISRAFNQAWTEGARTQGVEPEERTPEEETKLQEMINTQATFIPGLADFILSHAKEKPPGEEGALVGLQPSEEPPELGELTGTERTSGEFVPAKSKEEAITRLNDLTNGSSFGTDQLSGVDFEGVKLEKMNEILSGVEDVSTRYDVDFSYIGFQTKKRRSIGYWVKGGPDVEGRPTSALEIQKTFLRNPNKVVENTRQGFIFNKDKTVTKLLENIDDPRRALILARNVEQLEIIQATDRWAIFADAINPIEAVARHESYHGVFSKYNLGDVFDASLERHSFTSLTANAVSQYGASSRSELFAEAATALDMGIPIPKPIANAVMDTLGTILR